ncbi:MAG: CoA-transferase subunit beta [Kineosporiaceae bacterium]
MSDGWTIDEWFVVALARTIGDGEVVFHGFASPCAQVAMHVARRTHAPRSLLIEGATYAVDPDPGFIPPTSNDLALHRDAVYRMRFEEFFDAAQRGAVDRMFLSGGQIDGYGNTNVTAIGGMPHPKIKLGGGGGGGNISATVGALTVWTTRHRSGRTLVPTVDFLTDLGHVTPSGTRAELGYTGGGPQWLVTELGLFDYAADGHARLRETFPDVTVADVEQATGFELRTHPDVVPVRPPDAAELAAVRAVDPLGVRRLEFGPRELERTFGPAG